MALSGWVKRNVTLVSVSFVATIVAGILTYYYAAVHERKPTLVFEVTNDVNVYDVRKPIRDLRILFQGEDVEGQKLGLRILVLRVQNTGEADILQGHYDTKEAWGFKVVGGRLIEVRLTDTNSDYLRRRINPALAAENSVVFDKVIFERCKFVIFEVLVLHPRDVRSRIEPFGKIAGIDALQSIETLPGTDPTLFEKSVSGPVVVQVIRMFVYFVGFIAALVALIFAGIGIGRLISLPARRRRRREIREILSGVDPQVRNALERVYVESGRVGLESIKLLLSDPVRLKATARSVRRMRRGADVNIPPVFSDAYIVAPDRTFFPAADAFSKLYDAGLLRIDKSTGGEVRVSPALTDALTSVLNETTPKDRGADEE